MTRKVVANHFARSAAWTSVGRAKLLEPARTWEVIQSQSNPHTTKGYCEQNAPVREVTRFQPPGEIVIENRHQTQQELGGRL